MDQARPIKTPNESMHMGRNGAFESQEFDFKDPNFDQYGELSVRQSFIIKNATQIKVTNAARSSVCSDQDRKSALKVDGDFVVQASADLGDLDEEDFSTFKRHL
jgi:hypothetical protein